MYCYCTPTLGWCGLLFILKFMWPYQNQGLNYVVIESDANMKQRLTGQDVYIFDCTAAEKNYCSAVQVLASMSWYLIYSTLSAIDTCMVLYIIVILIVVYQKLEVTPVAVLIIMTGGSFLQWARSMGVATMAN